MLPLLLLFLLCIPLPNAFRSYVRGFFLTITDSVLFFKIPGAGRVTIYFICTVAAAVLFYFEILETVRTVDKERFFGRGVSTELKDKARCQRWRAERNFWISAFSFILWVILYRVRSLMREAEHMKADRDALMVQLSNTDKEHKE